MSYIGNINQLAIRNDNFREVLWTGENSQLVIMSLNKGEEIGEEVHTNVEQTIFIITGICEAVLNGESKVLSAGDVVVVSKNTKHNFINKGDEVVKIITSYSPPNHIDKRIHKTKEEAINDIEDEKFGEGVA